MACGTALLPATPPRRTPQHIAERVLQDRRSVEGERKAVTVLFADIEGSTGLIEHRDPEDARLILEPTLQAMTDAVHRFDGVVSKVMGDGLMALFGAPLALEDHAVRACCAALAIRAAVRERSAQLRAEHGIELQVRIGLHSGEVVVLAVGTDLHMDYDAVGATVHLAARMEQLAPADAVRLSAETARLAGDRVRLAGLGPVPIPGFSEPVQVFELQGIDEFRTQDEVAPKTTPIIGRAAEFRALMDFAGQAARGRGRAVLVTGEAGIGKSRICAEIAARLRSEGWLLLTARAVSYEVGEPWRVVRRLLQARFGTSEAGEMAGRITAAARELGLDDAVPGLLEAVGSRVDDPPWRALKADERRRRVLGSCQSWLLAESRRRPVLVFIDDVPWVDDESATFLSAVADRLAQAAVLLLLASRPDEVPDWAGQGKALSSPLEPLAAAESAAVLDSLIGKARGLAELATHIIERAGGNPLFLGEIVRALEESDSAGRAPDDLRESLEALPPTVQSIIAARIDSLSAPDKALLQVAAVVGPCFEFGFLADVVAAEPDQIRADLARLQARSFVRERKIFPQLEFAFEHPLVMEVAYRGLLKERRRELHRRVLRRLEAEAGNSGGAARLAHHALGAEAWEPAARHCQVAARHAAAQSAYQEAAKLYRKALDALARLPAGATRAERGVDLRIELRHALFPLGRFGEIHALLDEAEAGAETLGDPSRLCVVLTHSMAHHLGAGRHGEAVRTGTRALALAQGMGDGAIERDILFHLVQAHASRGEYSRAVELGRRIVGLVPESAANQTVFSLVHMWLAWCSAELGAFPGAHRYAEAALAIARQVDQPLPMLIGHLARGLVCLRQERPQEAAAWLEVALSMSERPALRAWWGAVGSPLGRAWVLLGRAEDAVALLEKVVAHTSSTHGSGHVLRTVHLGEAHLAAGHLGAAEGAAAKALEVAREHGERGHEAYALLLHAQLAACRQDRSAAVEHARAASNLAALLGMKPLQVRALELLGPLTREQGDDIAALAVERRASDLKHELSDAA